MSFDLEVRWNFAAVPLCNECPARYVIAHGAEEEPNVNSGFRFYGLTVSGAVMIVRRRGQSSLAESV